MAHLFTQPEHLWTVPIVPTAALLVVGVIYLRGWFRARHIRPSELPPWRAWSFVTGLAVLFFALASPLDTLSGLLLLLHMSQHILLMSVIPPLIGLGAPVAPLLWGLPRWVVRLIVTPLMGLESLHRFVRRVSTSVFATLLMTGMFIAWHLPLLYEFALRSERWHDIEHLCFLTTSLLFWWKIVEPWPVHRPWSPWTKLACLVGADVANTAVSAYLTFCNHVVYPSYAHVPRLFDITPVNDQSGAGAEMWVINSLVFLIPAMVIPLRALAPSFTRRSQGNARGELESI